MDRAATKAVSPSPNSKGDAQPQDQCYQVLTVKVMQFSYPDATKKNAKFVKAVGCLLAIPTA